MTVDPKSSIKKNPRRKSQAVQREEVEGLGVSNICEFPVALFAGGPSKTGGGCRVHTKRIYFTHLGGDLTGFGGHRVRGLRV